MSDDFATLTPISITQDSSPGSFALTTNRPDPRFNLSNYDFDRAFLRYIHLIDSVTYTVVGSAFSSNDTWSQPSSVGSINLGPAVISRPFGTERSMYIHGPLRDVTAFDDQEVKQFIVEYPFPGWDSGKVVITSELDEPENVFLANTSSENGCIDVMQLNP